MYTPNYFPPQAPARTTGQMAALPSEKPIVCGDCNSIVYRATSLTCQRCGSYFPTKQEKQIHRPPVLGAPAITVAAGTVVAAVVGVLAAAATFVIALAF